MRSNKGDLVRFGSKSFILTAAILVILGSVISGTVAWMFIKADPVSNTFTYGDIKIELTETDTKDNDDDKKTNSYSFAPDAVIAKDPMVTVAAGGEACWLFVELKESDNFDDYMTYSIADGWSKLEDGVYYRKVAAAAEDQVFYVLKDSVVTVKSDVTQEMLDQLAAEDYPTLEAAAYAVQIAEVDTAAEAWKLAEK